MSARRLFAASAIALLGGVGLAVPAAAHAPVQPLAASVTDFSLGRLGSVAGGLLGLAAVVIAVLALRRPAGRLGVVNGPFGATAAVVAGLIGTALGGLVAATADGGLGTGNGLGGAYVALLLGLAGTALGGGLGAAPVAPVEPPAGRQLGRRRAGATWAVRMRSATLCKAIAAMMLLMTAALVVTHTTALDALALPL